MKRLFAVLCLVTGVAFTGLAQAESQKMIIDTDFSTIGDDGRS